MSEHHVNQRGIPIFVSPVLTPYDLSDHEAKRLLLLLIDHLNLGAAFTNATKHGGAELIIKSKE